MHCEAFPPQGLISCILLGHMISMKSIEVPEVLKWQEITSGSWLELPAGQ